MFGPPKMELLPMPMSMYYVCFHTAMKLDEKNVLNLLHEAKFADGDWELLGQQLIDRASLITIGPGTGLE